ncbi:FK506-binding protein 5 isoform X2 [Labrus mixtus]|uniref:FK506-binding protein 5 isoform X2 n=1 Tax=Labrus mixtus TaxID=508554 RepID=UPI0029C0A8B3|nr:FK506-binding protein 5 isoform X2 [Labrus mixtus]
MDHTEDLSARVLLKHILTTEPPRTPITRSATSRSSRQGNKDGGAQTPQDLLRHSLKHRLRESITRKSLPPPKRRTASVVLKRINMPATASMLFDDGDTPRHILRNILRTEPVRTPVVHDRAASGEPQPSSANSSIASKRQSTELSGFDLPDLTISDVVSTAKGLSRKRPRRSLNVTAFEKRLRDGEDVEGQNEEASQDNSSLSLSSSTSLSLKTPYVDVHTEKRGLQRRVSNRRKITEEEFGAAVNRRHMGEASSFVQPERGPSDTAYSEGFTLGLSKLSEPDITTDILHCNTALYAQTDAMTSNYTTVATQDKPTAMASQLQRQMSEMEQSELREEKSMNAFPTEEEAVAEPQGEEYISESQENAGGSTTNGQAQDVAVMSKSEDEENVVEAQTGEEGATDSQADEEEEEKEDGGVDSEPEEDGTTRSQSEEVQPDSRTQEEKEEEEEEEEKEDAVESQIEEECAVDAQHEEEEKDEDDAVDSQSDEKESAVDSLPEEEEEEEEEEEVAEYESNQEDPAEVSVSQFKPEDEHDGEEEVEEDGEQASEQLDGDLEHVSRRAHRSEGGLVVPVTEAEGDLADGPEARLSDGKSKAYTTFDLQNIAEMGSHESGPPHSTEFSNHGQRDASEAEKENSFDPPPVMQDIEDNGQMSDESPEEAAAQEEEEEEEEEWEDDEEIEDAPSKTPAFVRQKRDLLRPDPLASPSVLKNIQASASDSGDLPAPAPKQVRKRRAGPSRKAGGLPKNYLMSIFKHFAKTKVSADVYPVLQEIMDKFFERLADDLETYAIHAKRKTIEVEDAELLLRRQGHVSDKVPVEVLIEKYLRMDQRRLLIPIATSGNVVFPKKRR